MSPSKASRSAFPIRSSGSGSSPPITNARRSSASIRSRPFCQWSIASEALSSATAVLISLRALIGRPCDRVLFLPASGLEVELDGEDLVLLRERDVQAVSSQPAARDRAPGQYL